MIDWTKPVRFVGDIKGEYDIRVLATDIPGEHPVVIFYKPVNEEEQGYLSFRFADGRSPFAANGDNGSDVINKKLDT